MTVTFAECAERMVGEHYTKEQKDYLNKIFMTREKTLKPRRKDDKAQARAMLAALAKDYEEFIFDTIKRRMEEQSRVKNTLHSRRIGGVYKPGEASQVMLDVLALSNSSMVERR